MKAQFLEMGGGDVMLQGCKEIFNIFEVFGHVVDGAVGGIGASDFYVVNGCF